MALHFCKSALLRGITSKNNGEFYCLNDLYSLRIKSKLESYEKVCENKDFCGVVIPSEDIKMLDFNQYPKPDKTPSIIHAILESFMKGIDGYQYNFQKSPTAKVTEYISFGDLMSMIWTFYGIENKHDVYRAVQKNEVFY